MPPLVRVLFVSLVLGAVCLSPWPVIGPDVAAGIAIVGLSAFAVMGVGVITARAIAADKREEIALAAIKNAIHAHWAVSVPVALFRALSRQTEPELLASALELGREGLTAARRRFGIPLMVLGYFAFWTFLYLLLWSRYPARCPANPAEGCEGGAFLGVPDETTVGDFLYLAVNAAFVSLPPDLIAHSQAAHSVVVLEIFSGAMLLAALGADFLRRQQQAVTSNLPATTAAAPADRTPPA